jgi:phosphoglycolate phosphatase
MSQIRFVIFDVDGTLVDSQEMIVRCLQAACVDLGIPVPHSRQQLLSGVGLPLREAIPKAVPEIKPEQIGPFHDRFRHHYTILHDNFDHSLQPLYPGARAMLAELRAEGMTLGICTSKMMVGLNTVLEQHELRDLFVSIKTPDFGPGKPDPFLLNMAMREENFTPQQTLFVGDSTYDMQAGVAAGVRCLAVAWGYHTPEQLLGAGAHKLIQRMDQLVPSVKSWAV